MAEARNEQLETNFILATKQDEVTKATSQRLACLRHPIILNLWQHLNHTDVLCIPTDAVDGQGTRCKECGLSSQIIGYQVCLAALSVLTTC